MSGPERFSREIALLVTAYRNASDALLRLLLRLIDSFDTQTLQTPEQAAREAESGVTEVIAALQQAVRAWMAEAPKMYVAGVRDTGAGNSEDDLTREQRSSMNVQITAATSRLLSATEAMREDALGKLREIARRRVQALMRGEEGIGRSIGDFRRELQDEGITLRDRLGRKIRPGPYAESALRAISANLLNSGTVDTAATLGAPGVRVRDGDFDEACRIADGQAWGLEYAANHLIEHPSCVRSMSVLVSSFSGELDRE